MCYIGSVVAVHDIPKNEPLIVFRAFYHAEHTVGQRLYPVSEFFRSTWANPNEIAVADRRPTRSNHHGLWAYFDADDRQRNHSYSLRGMIAVWGRVVEHEYGVRAQYAQVLELDVPERVYPYDVRYKSKVVDELRKAYHLTTPTSEDTK